MSLLDSTLKKQSCQPTSVIIKHLIRQGERNVHKREYITVTPSHGQPSNQTHCITIMTVQANTYRSDDTYHNLVMELVKVFKMKTQMVLRWYRNTNKSTNLAIYGFCSNWVIISDQDESKRIYETERSSIIKFNKERNH